MNFKPNYPTGKALWQFYDGYIKIVPFKLLQQMDTLSSKPVPNNAPTTAMFFVIGGHNQQGVETRNYFHEIRISAHSGDLTEAPFTGDQQGNESDAYKFMRKTIRLGGAILKLDGTPNFKGGISFSFTHPLDGKTIMNAICDIESNYTTAPSPEGRQ